MNAVMRDSLGLDSEWQVDEVTFNPKERRIDVYLSHSGQNLICPETGEPGVFYDRRRERVWRHLDWFQSVCYIHCRLPRVKSSAGIKTMEIPWTDPSSHATHSFESWAIEILRVNKNQTKTAGLIRCSFDQVHAFMHRGVERGMKRRKLEAVAHVSVDEKALRRGHVYATIVCDSTRGVVLDVGEGRTKKGTIALLERIFEDLKEKVETVSIDMWKAFIGAVKTVFPEAALIHDRFHLIQYLNTALNKVRQREVKTHPEELKGSRFALLKNEKNRTKTQEEIFKIIQEANLEVSVAWRLREDFKALFNSTSFAEAKKDFDLWIKSVETAGVKEVIKIAEMFREHYEGVCNALCHPQSNAIAERMNGKIQEIKTIGRGYRRFENFRVAILFFCGGLDLKPHKAQ